MDTKLDCEVDVEGIADMVDRREEGSMSRRPCLRPDTAHSPRASRHWQLDMHVRAPSHTANEMNFRRQISDLKMRVF
jgi:hypothetical protein